MSSSTIMLFCLLFIRQRRDTFGFLDFRSVDYLVELRFPLDVYETVSTLCIWSSPPKESMISEVQFYWLTLRGSPNVQRSALNLRAGY